MAVTLLRDGDYCPNGAGGFVMATGAAEVLEKVLFRLSVRRGSFPFLPELGSRLYLLPRAKASEREALAAAYAAEALADVPELAVTGTVWNEEDRSVTVYLAWQGETLRADVDV